MNAEKFINQNILTYLKKNNDYGNSYNDSLDKYGILAFQVRAGDKIKRLVSLRYAGNPQEVDDEAVEDTTKDLFIYSCMTKAWENSNEANTLYLKVLITAMQNFIDFPQSFVSYLEDEYGLFDDITEYKDNLRLYLYNYLVDIKYNKLTIDKK